MPAGPDLSVIRSRYPIDRWFVAEGRAASTDKDAPRLARLKAERELAGQVLTSISSEALYLTRGDNEKVQREYAETTRLRSEAVISQATVVYEGTDLAEKGYRIILAVERSESSRRGDLARSPAVVRAAIPAHPVTVESSAEVPWPDDWTVGKARQAALDQARRKAVEQALGVEVRGDTVMQNDQIVQDLSRSLARGRILTETILDEGPVDPSARRGDLARSPVLRAYHLRLRAEVQPAGPEARLGLRASLDKPLYTDGEEVALRVEVDRDAFLYIFNVGEDSAVTLLYPNGYEAGNLLRAHAPFIFPSDALRTQGVRLRARLPAGRARSTETLKVLALKEPLPNLDGRVVLASWPPSSTLPFQSWSGTSTDLMVLLRTALSTTTDWSDLTLPFEVVSMDKKEAR